MYLTLCSLMRKAVVTRSSVRWSKPFKVQTVWCGLTFPRARRGARCQPLPSRSCLHHPLRMGIWHVGIPCRAFVQPTSLTGNRIGNSTGCRLLPTECLYQTSLRNEDQGRPHTVRCFLVVNLWLLSRPPFSSLASAAACHYANRQGELLSPDVGRGGSQTGDSSLLTCSSSVHTATGSGDCCSQAAYQCVRNTVWEACTMLVTFSPPPLPPMVNGPWTKELPGQRLCIIDRHPTLGRIDLVTLGPAGGTLE
jgi:hypothetical protein